ncbi:MAG TPA: hypothetical protein VF597_03080 [Candidatus Saccharimonadales bacterium]|jgi:hypothetical protein
MGKVFELDGQLFETEGEFLDAAAHEYKTGDQDLAKSTLEEYGYSLNDVNVRPEGA